MRKTIAILFILLMSSTAIAQNSIWFSGTFEEAKVEAEKNGKLILVDFYKDG